MDASVAARCPLSVSLLFFSQERRLSRKQRMSKKTRHGAEKRRKAQEALLDEANQCFQRGEYVPAQNICREILARDSSNIGSLNLLGLIHQALGHHVEAIEFFNQAIALNGFEAACHYNVGSSYQDIKRWREAALHFSKAIALGLGGKSIENLILENTSIAACLERVEKRWPIAIDDYELFGVSGIESFANDVFLQCALKSLLIQGLPFEVFLTHVRSALLRLADSMTKESRVVDERITELSCALAQQCFINEYIYAAGNEELALAIKLRALLRERVEARAEVSPLVLGAVAAYFPLHSLGLDGALLAKDWPESVVELLRQQILEPSEERQDRSAIPVLTVIDDSVSQQVMQQYEENPYPRWNVNPLAMLAGQQKSRSSIVEESESGRELDILIAGCGTGQHPVQTATLFPHAHILAIDMSLASLAYARRKTLEEGIRNVEYAQADILKLESIGRTFDRVEVLGVLHHLANPKDGWRVLLSLLRRNGQMRVALYSRIARRPILDAYALIRERGYRATDEDIRKFRREIMRSSKNPRWQSVIRSPDFYSISGCRDEFFNVMAHWITIPEIKALLDELNLLFLGFDVAPQIKESFVRQFPGDATLYNLDFWHTFEESNPATFGGMYFFTIAKN